MNSLRQNRNIHLGTDFWTITFADLLTLLIGFFVLRYTMYIEKLPVSFFPTKPASIEITQETSQLFEQIKNFLNKTTQYRELVTNTENGIQTTVVFDGIASLSSISRGAQIELQSASVATSVQELSLASRAITELIGTALSKRGDLIVIQYQTPLITSVGGISDSGWNTSSAKAAVVYRQLIDAGVNKERIFVEAFSNTNGQIKGNITISILQRDENLTEKLSRNDVLLNLNTANPASESEIAFLDL